MKYVVSLIFLALIAAGCSKKEPAAEPVATAATSTDASVGGHQPEPIACTSFYSPLPDPNIRFDFTFHIAKDRFYLDDRGGNRRAISIEHLEGDRDQALSKVESAMLAAGFKGTGKTSAGDDGMVRQSFVKDGFPTLFIAISSDTGSNPSNPNAKGIIWISWPLPSQSSQGDGVQVE